MKKQEFVSKLAKNINSTKKDANQIVEQFGAIIMTALRNGDEVVFPFGKFQLKKRAAREARNPFTGQRISVAARVVPHFKASKRFKDEVVA